MSETDNQLHQQHRFEIRTTSNPTAEQKMALLALAREYGWDIINRTPDTTAVTPEELVNKSVELFGESSSGELANILVDTGRRGAYGYVLDTTFAEYRAASSPYVLNFSDRSRDINNWGYYYRTAPQINLETLSNNETLAADIVQALRTARAEEYEREQYGFAYTCTLDISGANTLNPVTTKYGTVVRYVNPGRVTSDSLRNYVEWRNWDQIVPSGSIGRIAKILADVAGVDMPESTNAEDDNTYLSISELNLLALNAGITPATFKGIADRIERAFSDTLHGRSTIGWTNITNDPSSPDVFTFEFEGKTSGRLLQGIKIARKDVPKIARLYSGRSDAIAFLENFEV